MAKEEVSEETAKAERKAAKQNRDMLILGGWIVFSLLAIVLTVYYPSFLSWLYLKDADGRGEHGEQFGGLNAVFTALAFVALAATVLLQREELQETREELTRQADALHEQNRHHQSMLNLQKLVGKISADLELLPFKRMQAAEIKAELEEMEEYRRELHKSRVEIEEDPGYEPEDDETKQNLYHLTEESKRVIKTTALLRHQMRRLQSLIRELQKRIDTNRELLEEQDSATASPPEG